MIAQFADAPIHISTRFVGPLSVVDATLADHAEAVLREAISNAVRHSGATELAVRGGGGRRPVRRGVRQRLRDRRRGHRERPGQSAGSCASVPVASSPSPTGPVAEPCCVGPHRFPSDAYLASRQKTAHLPKKMGSFLSARAENGEG